MTGRWAAVGKGYQPLYGNLTDPGYCVEWHDFTTEHDLDWAPSFQANSLGICLNISGYGRVQAGRRSLELGASTAGFYAQNETRLAGMRRGGERHQFITVGLSVPFLQRHALVDEKGFDTRLSKLFNNTIRESATVSEATRLTSECQQLVLSLRNPPVLAVAQRLWYEAKALEVAAAMLFQPAPGEELFCERYKRLAQDRVEKVITILKQNLAEPPPLEAIGKQVGCSHFHLSRLFAQEMGKTISAYLRDLRMERAADLLCEGKLNVTEAAFEVGYSSLSHFTVAFRETFGCCPGLYPLKPVSRKN